MKKEIFIDLVLDVLTDNVSIKIPKGGTHANTYYLKIKWKAIDKITNLLANATLVDLENNKDVQCVDDDGYEFLDYTTHDSNDNTETLTKLPFVRLNLSSSKYEIRFQFDHNKFKENCEKCVLVCGYENNRKR